ncbi:hypothetical protein ABTY53_31195 [Streptomyces noursei]|uniref:hypothetical protein n=1 Tax=Streptomyces noursei TaxID=1971 RepID=UPI00331BBA22
MSFYAYLASPEEGKCVLSVIWRYALSAATGERQEGVGFDPRSHSNVVTKKVV